MMVLKKAIRIVLLNKEVNIQLYDENTQEYMEPAAFTIVGILKEPSYDWYRDTSIQFSDSLLVSYPDLITYPSTTIYVDSMENVMPVLELLKEQNYQVYSQVEQLEELDLFFLIFKNRTRIHRDNRSSHRFNRYFQYNDDGRNRKN